MTSFAFDSLSIHIEADGFSFFKRKGDLVIRKRKRCEPIGYESSKKIAEEIVNLIKEKEFSLLKRIKLIFSNKLFTLVPDEFYNEDKASAYIEFNHFLMPDDPIETQWINDLKIHFLFSYDESIEREIKKFSSKTVVIAHSGKQLISGLYQLIPEKKYFIYFNSASIEFIFFNEEQLIFYNYFEVKTKEDILYYLLFVAEQLKIDINQVLICLLGNITLWPKAIEMMKKYVRYVDTSLNDDPVVKENIF